MILLLSGSGVGVGLRRRRGKVWVWTERDGRGGKGARGRWIGLGWKDVRSGLTWPIPPAVPLVSPVAPDTVQSSGGISLILSRNSRTATRERIA